MESTRNAGALFGVLAEKASGGDQRSFQQIYDAIAGKMYSLCLRYAGNAEDANDWFQEGCVKLYRNLGNFRGDGSFEGWARRIFVGTCIDSIKKRNLLFPAIREGMDVASDDLTGYDNLTNEDLMRFIRQLPDGYRTVVNLYLVEGYNHKEIGDLLHISEEGSRSQLFRARVLLQKMLTNKG
ncbi:MAG TPA: sigma-70 family RNA polymerase sigma factor [Puia sp.]|jgi:RNA polymerase sigma-70 factor (ECF subfamily)|nr:sigma-70 family RNA polymerase sigma factor [Puia sp.]